MAPDIQDFWKSVKPLKVTELLHYDLSWLCINTRIIYHLIPRVHGIFEGISAGIIFYQKFVKIVRNVEFSAGILFCARGNNLSQDGRKATDVAQFFLLKKGTRTFNFCSNETFLDLLVTIGSVWSPLGKKSEIPLQKRSEILHFFVDRDLKPL